MPLPNRVAKMIPRFFSNKTTNTNKFLFALIFYLACSFIILWFYKIALVYDDQSVFENNIFVKAKDFYSIWTTPYWAGEGQIYQHENLFRPLFLSLASIFSIELIRILVLLCHVINTFFLFHLTKKNLFLSLIFLTHPVLVETTSQAVGLMEALTATLGIASFILLESHPIIASIFICILPGIKETGFVWSGLFFLALYRKITQLQKIESLEQKKISSDQLKLIAFIIILSIAEWLYLRQNASGSFFGSNQKYFELLNPLVNMDFIDALFSRLTIIGYSIKLFFIPHPLSSDYSLGTLPLPGYLTQVWVWIALGFLYFLYNSRKKFNFIIITCLLTLLPTLSIPKPSAMVFAERFCYSFYFGILFLLSQISFPLESYKKRFTYTSLIKFFIITLFFTLTLSRQILWSNPEKIVLTDIKNHPMNAKLHHNLGMYYGGHDQWQDAKNAFQSALGLYPAFPEAHYRMSLVQTQLGNDLESKHFLIQAAQLGHSKAQAILSQDQQKQPHLNEPKNHAPKKDHQ